MDARSHWVQVDILRPRDTQDLVVQLLRVIPVIQRSRVQSRPRLENTFFQSGGDLVGINARSRILSKNGCYVEDDL